MNEYVGSVDGRYEGRMEDAGVTLIRGEGSFSGTKMVKVGGRELTADKIVVATGSRPSPAPFADLPVWTSDDLFPLESKPPERLLVIGGGFIGCEMAAFFAGVGTETKLFARSGRLLAKEDREVEAVFQEEFTKAVDTYCHASLKGLTHDGAEFTATFEIHGESQVFRADRVLFAIGRKPNTDMLNVEATGLALNKRGFLPVNDELETEVEEIFAAGDVNGRFMLQHAASAEVNHLRGRFLKGDTGPVDESLVAHAVFTHPEVASVGATEDDLKESGVPYVSVFEDWLASE